MTRRPSLLAPRFRLSTLLLFVAVAAVALWWLVIRPRQFAAMQTAAGQKAIHDRDRAYLDFVFDQTVKNHLVTVLGDSRLTHWSDVLWIACPDAKTIAAAGGDGTLIVWNREDGAILHGFYDVAASCYARDINRFFFIREDGKLKSWAIDEKEPKAAGIQFPKSGGGSQCSPNGRYFVSQIAQGTPGKAIWDRETGKRTWEAPGDYSAVAFAPDSKTVVFVNTTTIHEYDLADGTLLASIPMAPNKDGSRATTRGAVFADDGSRLYTSNASGVVTVYEWPKREVLYVSSETLGSVHHLDADSNNYGFMASGQNVRHYMEWKATGELKSMTFMQQRATALDSGAFGRVIGLAGGRIVAMNGSEPSRLKGGPRADAACFAFSPDGERIVLGGSDGQIIVRETAGWTRVQSWKAHEGRIRRILWPRDDLMVSVGEDNTLAAWDAETGIERFSTWCIATIAERGLAFDVRNNRFTKRNVLNTTFIDADSFVEHPSLGLPPLAARGEIVFAHDGGVFGGGRTSLVDVISAVRKKLIASMGGGRVGDDVNLVLSRDESTVYAVDYKNLQAFDVKSTKPLWSVGIHPGSVNDIARHPKLPLIATCGSDGHLTLVDAKKGTVAKRLRLGPVRGDILQVDFSPDGDLLAAAMSNGSVVVLRTPWE